MKIKDKDELREKLASIEHDQWVAWSKAIAKTENIEKSRLKHWKELWCDYDQLSDKMKKLDREWADAVIEVIEAHLEEVKMCQCSLNPKDIFSIEEHMKRLKDTDIGCSGHCCPPKKKETI